MPLWTAPIFPEQFHLQKMCVIVWCYTGPLDQAEKRWLQMMAPYKGTKIVTYHRSWPNFAARFGLKRREVYARALELKRGDGEGRTPGDRDERRFGLTSPRRAT